MQVPHYNLHQRERLTRRAPRTPPHTATAGWLVVLLDVLQIAACANQTDIYAHLNTASGPAGPVVPDGRDWWVGGCGCLEGWRLE